MLILMQLNTILREVVHKQVDNTPRWLLETEANLKVKCSAREATKLTLLQKLLQEKAGLMSPIASVTYSFIR